jgi:hypothetical protein
MQVMADRMNDAKFEKLESFELRGVEQWMANVPNEVNPYVPVYTSDDWDGRDDVDDGDTEGVNWGALDELWKTLAKCSLKRLAITSVQSTDSLLRALGTRSWPTVEELDLSDSALTDDEAAQLGGELGKKFPALKRLIIERTSVTPDRASALRKAGWETVVHSTNENAPSWRYVVGAE